MQPPRKPDPLDCCGSGCIPCVYDVYADQMERYRQWLSKQEKEEQDEEDGPPDS